jgi:hypothetical protein
VKPRVYVETTIISYLVGRLNQHNLFVAGNQEFTRRWWAERRNAFDLFASAVVLAEVNDGNVDLAAERTRLLHELTLLDVTDKAEMLQQEILRSTGIPRKAAIDALHIAVAAVNGMDYLISWNCKHIANAVTLPKVYAVCERAGYEPPFVCTPPELTED